MPNFLYVDNSNVWIEGMRVSAVQNGIAPDIWAAHDHQLLDYNRKIDFGRLFEFAGGDRADVGRAVLYGSRPPRNDSLWAIAERKGFEVVLQDRSVSNREKKIDTGIATDIVADSFELMDLPTMKSPWWRAIATTCRLSSGCESGVSRFLSSSGTTQAAN